jgi:hypothetical protein
MSAADLLYPSVPLWAWFALAGAIAFLYGFSRLLVKGGDLLDAARADCLLPTDDETVEQYADRTLPQFACPHLDQADIDRLRAAAAKQAAEARAPQPRGRL